MSFSSCKTWENKNFDTLNDFLLNQSTTELPDYSECCEYSPSCHTGWRHPRPSPYYTRRSFRMPTTPFAHMPGVQASRHMSNFIGPGTNEYELIVEGYPPMSLSDTCAMIHDIMYSLSRSNEDNLNADRTLASNLDFVREVYNEPLVNTLEARTIAEGGSRINISAGSGGASLVRIKNSGDWPQKRPVYERILTTVKRVGFDIGFLDVFYSPLTNSIDLSTL